MNSLEDTTLEKIFKDSDETCKRTDKLIAYLQKKLEAEQIRNEKEIKTMEREAKSEIKREALKALRYAMIYVVTISIIAYIF